MEKMNVSGGIIVKRDEDGVLRCLLIQRAADDHWPLHWEFARGKCDGGKGNLNEGLIDCLKREIKEETGLDIKPVRYIGEFKYTTRERETTQYNFLCSVDENQKVKLSKEHDDYKWVNTIGQITTMVNAGEMRNILIKAFQMFEENKGIISQPDKKIEKIKEIYQERFKIKL